MWELKAPETTYLFKTVLFYCEVELERTGTSKCREQTYLLLLVSGAAVELLLLVGAMMSLPLLTRCHICQVLK